MNRRLAGLIVPGAFLVALCRIAVGEVFVLSNGGRVVGELLNADESPREKFVIQLPTGGRITLQKSQVQQVLHPQPAELEYEKLCPRYADTVEDQWKLAGWCLEHGLQAQRKTHLERVIELDPDHAEARRALGYSRIDGQWTTPDEVMKARGYVRYKNSWKLPQQIELIETQEKIKKAESEWSQKINRWRGWLGSDKDQSARESIRAVADPSAVKALVAALKADARPQARTLYVETLAKIGTPEAIKQLGVRSIEDADREVRLTCLDYLKKQKHPDVVAYYVSQLRSKDNQIVNRAAVGLSCMNDPSAIGPLIDALITTHKFTISSGSPGSISTTFGTGGTGGGGMSVGGGPKIIKQEFQNQAVLDALITLSGGVNFNFDVKAWKYWYASRKQHDTIDARRN